MIHISHIIHISQSKINNLFFQTGSWDPLQRARPGLHCRCCPAQRPQVLLRMLIIMILFIIMSYLFVMWQSEWWWNYKNQSDLKTVWDSGITHIIYQGSSELLWVPTILLPITWECSLSGTLPSLLLTIQTIFWKLFVSDLQKYSWCDFSVKLGKFWVKHPRGPVDQGPVKQGPVDQVEPRISQWPICGQWSTTAQWAVASSCDGTFCQVIVVIIFLQHLSSFVVIICLQHCHHSLSSSFETSWLSGWGRWH